MDLLTAMRVYVRVVERNSMSAAARDLKIGQPAVSERIERLEAHLGTRLLRRNTRSMSMTEQGALFYERCKQVLAAADDALAVAGKSTRLRGLLRIAAPHGFGEEVLLPVLLRLREWHPELKVDLVLNDLIVDPVTEGVDISIRLGSPGEGYYVVRKIGHINRYLVASPEYLAHYGTPEVPEALIRHPFARVSGLFNNGRLPLLQNGNLTSAPVNIVFNVTHWRPLRAIILSGSALGVLQSPVSQSFIASGQLTSLLPGFSLPGFGVHLLYPPVNVISTEIKVCVDFLERELPMALAEAQDGPITGMEFTP